MKTIKSKFLVLSLILFTAIAFSSCDKDEFEYRQAELGYTTTIPVPPSGDIKHSFTVGYDWVEVINGGKYDYIDHINYRIGDIKVYEGPRVDRLIFRLQNSNVWFDWNINSNGGDIIYDTDLDIQHFYNEIVEMINRDGTATVLVSGKAAPSKEIKMDLLFKVNAYVCF